MSRRTIPGLLLLFAISSAGCTDLGRHDDIPARDFDAATWRTGDRRVRGTMVEDIEKRQLLHGFSKRQVVELLGLPEASDTAGLSMEYTVDLGLRTGPWGLGGTWLFFTTVVVDTTSGRVTEVRTRD